MNEKEERVKELNKLKPNVEPSELVASDWEKENELIENLPNSPETYRLLTEARNYFLIPGVIKKRPWGI